MEAMTKEIELTFMSITKLENLFLTGENKE